jgi:hypothetical protein
MSYLGEEICLGGMSDKWQKGTDRQIEEEKEFYFKATY